MYPTNMQCSHSSPTTVLPLEAIVTSSTFSLIFVLSLYLPWNCGDRDHPVIIRSRLLTLVFIALGCEVYVRLRTGESHSTPAPIVAVNPILGALVGILFTAALYSGHLLAMDSNHCHEYVLLWTRSPKWLPLRDYLVAPVLEELVFRRHSLLLWQCLPFYAQVIGPAALFSLAHLHHALRNSLVAVVAQLVYTFIFGVYAATLSTLTRSVAPAIAAHITCNLLGLPDIPTILSHRHKHFIMAAYITAVFTVCAFGNNILRAITQSSATT